MFNIVRERELKDFSGKGTLYRHDRTGMEVYHIKNDSEELSCAFAFATPSRDDMGVAHILEHTVLSGSGRFPVKDPFSQVYLSSPNTFLNALTFTDKTVYPFASPLKKDFDILFDIYSDAVFNPLLRKTSFQQEGVRFFDGKFDGVVYNEMCGDSTSEDSFVGNYCMRDLFQGTPAYFISGGDPKAIADLTYEEYLDRYRSWYSPSNCRLFLFGDLDAYEYLNKLEDRYLFEENLSKWNGTKYVPSSEKYVDTGCKPIRRTVGCPVEDASSVVMTWLVNGPEDSFNCLALNVLTDILLGDPGAPLYKAAVESDLGEDLNSMSGTDADFPLMPFTYGFTGAKKGKEDEIEAFIMDQLKKIVRDGLDKDQVKAAIKRVEFKLQEIPGGSLPYGLATALKSAKTWLRGKDPEEGFVVSDVLAKLKEEVNKGRFFENWIQKNLIDNPRRCLLTVVYDPDYTGKLEDLLKQKLEKRVLAEDKTVFEEEKKKFEAFVSRPDTEEELSVIPRIKVEDMPLRIPQFPVDERAVGKAKILEYRQKTNGIAYINMTFDTLCLDGEEKKLLPLLVRLMQMCPTSTVDYSRVSTLVKLYTGGFSISINNGLKADSSPVSYVLVRTKVLMSDIDDAADLVKNIILDGCFDDVSRVRAAITDICTEYESDYLDSAMRFAMTYASSNLSASLNETELTAGTTCYLNMKAMLEKSNEEIKELSIKLKAVRDKIFVKSGLVALVSSDPETIDKCSDVIASVIGDFKDGDSKISSYYTDFVPKRETCHSYLTVSSGPAYNAMVALLDKNSEEKTVCRLLFASAISNGVLWDTVRGKNGAYGVSSSVNIQDNIFTCWSYRDPSIEKTFKAYLDVLDYKVTDDEINYVKVSIIGKELKPMAPMAKSLEALRRYKYDMSDELYRIRRKALLEAKRDDVLDQGAEIKKAVENFNIKTTICGQQMVPDCKTINVVRTGL